MAEKAKKSNKNLIIGICAAVVAVVVIVVAAILATRGGTTKIDDSYFVTDDTKYVVTMDGDEEEGSATKVYYVFNHSGDKITGAAMYAEFENEDAAKAAFEEYKAENEDTTNVSVNGKYFIIKSEANEFEDYTLEDIKSIYEYDYEDEDEDYVEVDEYNEE